jgi:hypothetical protein
MMNYLLVGEDVAFLAVPLSDPQREGHGMNPSVLLNVMFLAEKKPVDKHVIYKLVRIGGVERFPIEGREVFTDKRTRSEVDHIRKAPFDRVMVCLKISHTATDEATNISLNELLASGLEQYTTIPALLMRGEVDLNRQGILLDVSLNPRQNFFKMSDHD